MINYIIYFIGDLSLSNVILMLLILFIIFLLFSDILKRSSAMKLSKPIIKTELICVRCGFKYVRNFKEDDFISKTTGEKCERCGGILRIYRIYSMEEKRVK